MPKRIDWTPIEADVRIGKLSLEHIAKKHAVSYSGLRMQIKQRGWTPDLTPAVQAATRAELAQQATRRARLQQDQEHTDQHGAQVQQAARAEVKVITSAIDAAVAENVAIINRHRSMSDALMRLVGSLADEVKVLTDTADDPELKSKTLGERVDAVRKLSQTVATVVDVERKAHSLDTQAPAEDKLTELVRALQGSSLPIVAVDPEMDHT
jgi:hypothetical protein